MKRNIKTYIIIRFGGVIVILSIIFSSLFILLERNTLIQEIDTDLFHLVRMQKELFATDFHDSIFHENSIRPEEYYKIVDRNNQLCIDLDLQYIWSVIVIDSSIHFTTASSPDKNVENNKHAKFFDIHSNPEAFDLVFENMEPIISEFHNEWGDGRMILSPYTDVHGRKYCFGISLSVEYINTRIKQSILIAILVLGLLLLLFLPIIYFISKSISEPIKSLTKVADNIANDKLIEPLAEKQKKWKEILSLNSSVIKMHEEIQNKIGALQTANKKLENNEEILQNQNIVLDKRVAEKTNELLLAKEKAEAIQKQFTALFEQIPLSIQIFNKDGLAINANKAWSELWQSPIDAMVNKYNVLEDKYAEETGWLDYLRKAFEGEVIHLPDMEYDPKQAGNIGRKRKLQVIAFPILIKDKVENIVLIHQDVTVIREYEQELIKAKVKAEESDQLKTEFLNNMSHEVRTPMNGIIGFSQLLDIPDIDEEKRTYYTRIIQQSSNQLLSVIDNIIEISKLGTNQVKVIDDTININQMLLELYAIFNIECQDKNILLQLENELPDGNCNIIIDQLKLYKTLSNLLENAVKYTDHGAITFGYEILTKDHGLDTKHEALCFFVKDTGIGVAKEKQEMIFDKFSQGISDLTRQYSGLGLGLSIAKQNTELMGGIIGLKSEKNVGSEFTVSLKYKKANSN